MFQWTAPWGGWVVAALALAGALRPAWAATWVVDADGAPEATHTRVQDAITSAASGDTVVVNPGTYRENLVFTGADLHLRGTAPVDPDVVAATVLDGRLLGPVIELEGGETAACIIEGFTIRSGQSDQGGGINGRFSEATIRNNVIEENVALNQGGGLSGCEGRIEGNTIRLNRAEFGGAFASCNGEIVSNTIRDNRATDSGGAFNRCAAAVRKNIIVGNTALNQGGAIQRGSGPIEDNFIERNTALEGAGLMVCSGAVRGNTIQGNVAQLRGGGVSTCNGTVEGNLIRKNGAPQGGGLYDCAGTIRGNTIVANLGETGAGLYDCDATIVENRIEGNVASFAGGGLSRCDGAIERNELLANGAPFGAALDRCTGRLIANRIGANTAQRGAGMDRCFGVIVSNLFEANTAAEGAAMHGTIGQIWHNTLARNVAGRAGGAIYFTAGSGVRANVFYANTGGALAAEDFGGARERPLIEGNVFFGGEGPLLTIGDHTTLTLMAELEALDWATGNTDADPRLLDPDGPDGDPATLDDNDYTPAAGSPLIDAGDARVLAWLPLTDASGLGRFAGAAPDGGAFEAASATDADGDGLNDDAEAQHGSREDLADTDGDGITDRAELLRGFNPTIADAAAGLRVPDDSESVQRAILYAVTGETIELAPGRYVETLDSMGKDFMLTGLDPQDWDVVRATRIDAFGQGRVVTLAGSETASCTLRGVHLSGGRAPVGAGIRGANSFALLTRCIVSTCTSTDGGTVDRLLNDVRENVFERNAGTFGGALSNVFGAIEGCTFTSNTATGDGGAIHEGRGGVTDCAFTGNRAAGNAGALNRVRGALMGNTFTGNRAGGNGGVGVQCTGAIEGNVFIDNRAEGNGGCLAESIRTIAGNEFRGNSARLGGCLYVCTGEIVGNVFTSNAADLNGGAIDRAAGLVLSDNLFEDNQAFSGGAISGSFTVIRDNTFRGNRASNWGGGIFGSGGLIQGNTLTAQSAEFGGALYSVEGEITSNTITDCHAEFDGGAGWDVEGFVHGNRIERNTAGRDGGAFHFCQGTTFERNTIVDNTAGRLGGAINSATGVLRGNLLANNRALLGGALATFIGDVINNTIVINVAELDAGGAMLDCPSTITNNIFDGNWPNAIWVGGENMRPLRIDHNCFHNNGSLIYTGPTTESYAALAALEAARPEVFANLEGSPAFVDSAAPDRDLRLGPASVCIDRGDPGVAISALDLAGLPRRIDGDADDLLELDMGAYEYFAVLFVNPGSLLDWRPGTRRTVIWRSEPLWAGFAVRLELTQHDTAVVVFGEFRDPSHRGVAELELPQLTPVGDYRLALSSSWDPAMRVSIPVTVRYPTASRSWMLYR